MLGHYDILGDWRHLGASQPAAPECSVEPKPYARNAHAPLSASDTVTLWPILLIDLDRDFKFFAILVDYRRVEPSASLKRCDTLWLTFPRVFFTSHIVGLFQLRFASARCELESTLTSVVINFIKAVFHGFGWRPVRWAILPAITCRNLASASSATALLIHVLI
jgi:hypothetical protein